MYEFSLGYVKNCMIKVLEMHSQGLFQSQEQRNQMRAQLKLCLQIYQGHYSKPIKSYTLSLFAHQQTEKLTQFPLNNGTCSQGPWFKQKILKKVYQILTEFFSDNCWFYLHKFAQIQEYATILNEIKNSPTQLSSFSASKVFTIKGFHSRNQKSIRIYFVLLCRIIRPQNLTYNMSQYVQKDLDKFYDQPLVTTVQEILSSSQFDVPVLFVLSTGVDPTSNILNYCLSKQLTLQTISLGQGQGKKAQALIERARNEGVWVLLNNCHLSKVGLETLRRLFKVSQRNHTKQNFRLLLSSMPVSYFPSNILQNSSKMTLEPPRGIKPNIQRCLNKQVNRH